LQIVVQTDFQESPIKLPVPLSEQEFTTEAGQHRETEVSIFLNITRGATTTTFVVVADDDAGNMTETWVFNPDTGLMEAKVSADQVFVADSAGNPTSVSLSDWLALNPIEAGDTWNTVYDDDASGNFQARTYNVQIFPNDAGDIGIVVNGDPVLADQIYGTAGGDTLSGNGGNDIIDGRGGNDVIFGGSGADNFKFADYTGSVKVEDFISGEDKIDLSALVSTTDLAAGWINDHVAQSGQDTLITVNDDLTIALKGVQNLSSSDFIVSAH